MLRLTWNVLSSPALLASAMSSCTKGRTVSPEKIFRLPSSVSIVGAVEFFFIMMVSSSRRVFLVFRLGMESESLSDPFSVSLTFSSAGACRFSDV